jgi:hypothetical protein
MQEPEAIETWLLLSYQTQIALTSNAPIKEHNGSY